MFRRNTTTKERPVETAQSYNDPSQNRPVIEQNSPSGPEIRQDTPVSTQPRGNGQAIREVERIPGREAMMEPRPIGLGRYLANWYTLVVGSALVAAEALLGLRLFFKLASADNANWIVKFTYHLSGVAIRPFTDIITNHELAGGILEPAVVIAMAVSLIGAVFAIWVVRSVASLKSWGSALFPR